MATPSPITHASTALSAPSTPRLATDPSSTRNPSGFPLPPSVAHSIKIFCRISPVAHSQSSVEAAIFHKSIKSIKALPGSMVLWFYGSIRVICSV